MVENLQGYLALCVFYIAPIAKVVCLLGHLVTWKRQIKYLFCLFYDFWVVLSHLAWEVAATPWGLYIPLE